MEQNGWDVDVGLDIFSMGGDELRIAGIDDIDAVNDIKKRCNMDSWFGFDNMLGNANVTKKFDHNGVAIISFSNCGDNSRSGSVIATLRSNGTDHVLGKALQDVHNLTETFNFTSNDVLSIEEQGYGIIKLLSFDVVCTENS